MQSDIIYIIYFDDVEWLCYIQNIIELLCVLS